MSHLLNQPLIAIGRGLNGPLTAPHRPMQGQIPDHGCPPASLVALDSSFAFREFRIGPAKTIIGRDAGQCGIVASGARISRRHACLSADRSGSFLLSDLQSTNGVFVNGTRIAGSIVLKDGDVIGLGSGNGQLCFRQGSADTCLSTLAAKDRWVIGRSLDCDIPLPFEPTVSSSHAVLSIRSGALKICDNHSLNGTWVNGRSIRECELGAGDTVTIGSTRFHFSLAENGTLNLRRKEFGQAVHLECLELGRHITDGRGASKRLLTDITLVIEPGEFVGILGPSGSGKTSLLTALNGYAPIERGTVLFNGVPLATSLAMYRNDIGYVPQDDILHSELSVEQSLAYTAQLRLPRDIVRLQRQHIVNTIIETMGLHPVRSCPIHQLSGGQRKRVSVGAELIVRPGLLFLDEPTAGLDPGVEEHLMRHFQGMAKNGTSVIISTHILTHVHLLDKVAILAQGRLVFFGTPAEALLFFSNDTEQTLDYARIFALLNGDEEMSGTDSDRCPPDQSREDIALHYASRYRESTWYRLHVEDRLSPQARLIRDSKSNLDQTSFDQNLPQGTARPIWPRPEVPAPGQPIRDMIHSWWVLSRRHLHIRCSSPRRLLVFLFIPAVLALVTLSQHIKGIPAETAVLQQKRMLHEGINRGGAFMESQLKSLLSPAGVYDHRSGADLLYSIRYEGVAHLPVPMSVLLMIVMTAIFSGTLIACLEISSERSIYRRERMSHLGIAAYLGSKLPFCMAMTGLQCFVFLLICWSSPTLRHFSFLPILLTMIPVAWCSVTLGLVLSTVDPSSGRFSVMLAIAAVLPQLVLSGGLGPDFYLGMTSCVRWAATLLPARWCLEMLCTALFQGIDGEGARWVPAFIREGIGFDFGTSVYYSGISILLIQSLFWLLFCAWFLKRRDIR